MLPSETKQNGVQELKKKLQCVQICISRDFKCLFYECTIMYGALTVYHTVVDTYSRTRSHIMVSDALVSTRRVISVRAVPFCCTRARTTIFGGIFDT